MMNLFKYETQEAMVKLIATQSDLIALYKDSSKSRDEIISNLRRLVDLQEDQISDLKLKLRELREKQ
jgi:NAD+--asparagine ADP-ribosyltransferase